MALMECPDCKNQVSTSADTCPHCGNKQFFAATGETKQIECFRCDGKGNYSSGSWWNKKETRCSLCKGSGLIKQKEIVNLRNNVKTFQDDLKD
jgi:DnaJ-class molecular chaperone